MLAALRQLERDCGKTYVESKLSNGSELLQVQSKCFLATIFVASLPSEWHAPPAMLCTASAPTGTLHALQQE